MKGTAGTAVAAHLLALAIALTGCGEDSGMRPGGDDSATHPQAELTVTMTPSAEAQPREWTLRCEPAGGTHPTPRAACTALHEAREPFEPVPPDAVCTQIYGGPETATIEGVWRGAQVHASYERTDGCEIARWDAITAVLQPHSASPSPSR